jgi:hypothetical protein
MQSVHSGTDCAASENRDMQKFANATVKRLPTADHVAACVALELMPAVAVLWHLCVSTAVHEYVHSYDVLYFSASNVLDALRDWRAFMQQCLRFAVRKH